MLRTPHVCCMRVLMRAPCPLPSVELTIFCFVFRLHPPSFLFVLALDSLPGVSIPLPTASLFSCPPPWPLHPRLPFLQGRGVACLQVSMSTWNLSAMCVPSLCVCVCVCLCRDCQ